MKTNGGHGLGVLVAIADGDERGQVAAATARAGHRVVVASDGPSVLELLEREVYRHRIDAAVLDPVLPGYPGLALAACIRSNRLPVAVIMIEDGWGGWGADPARLERLAVYATLRRWAADKELARLLAELPRAGPQAPESMPGTTGRGRAQTAVATPSHGAVPAHFRR